MACTKRLLSNTADFLPCFLCVKIEEREISCKPDEKKIEKEGNMGCDIELCSVHSLFTRLKKARYIGIFRSLNSLKIGNLKGFLSLLVCQNSFLVV